MVMPQTEIRKVAVGSLYNKTFTILCFFLLFGLIQTSRESIFLLIYLSDQTNETDIFIDVAT